MAVVDAYYDIERAPVKLALTAWLGAFLDEREGQNRALLEKMWADSGMTDAELLDMEVGLREQAAKLERAKAEALAGNKQAALKAMSEIEGASLRAWSNVYGRYLTGEYGRLEEETRQRGSTRRKLEEIKGEKIEAMQHDPQQEMAVDNLVRDYVGSGGAQSFDALRNSINGVLKSEDSKVKQDHLLYEEIQKLRNAQFGPPQNALADDIARSYFGDTDEKAYMAREHGFMTPEQEQAYVRESATGSVPLSGVYRALEQRVMNTLGQDEPIDIRTESGFRTSGSAGKDGEEPPTASGGGTGPRGARSYKVSGDASVAGPLLSVLSDPDATDAEISDAINKGIEAVKAKADELAALRAQKRQAPRYSGANYLLDNPNWIRNPRDLAALEKVAGRDRLAGDEFATRPGTARQAAREMVREGYDPDRPVPTTYDPVELGKGANYNVYAYFADTLARGEEWDDELARMPARSREIIAPYLRLPKDQAVSQLRKLADENDVTFLDIAADAVEAAAKDPSKLGELAELASGVAPEDEPWAARVNEVIDRAFKDGNRKTLSASLTSIAAGMREGRRQERSTQGKAAPLSPATTREQVQARQAADAEIALNAKEKAEADAGRKMARETYTAWRTEGMAGPAIDAKIAEVKRTSPRMTAFAEELTSLRGARIPDRPESVWEPKGPEQPMDLQRPDPRQRAEYLRRSGLAPEKEDIDFSGALNEEEIDYTGAL